MPLSMSKIFAGILFGIIVNIVLASAWMDVANIIVISSDFSPVFHLILLLGIPATLLFFNITDLYIMFKNY